MFISLKKERKYIIDSETEKRVLNYQEGYTSYVVTMKRKENWIQSQGMDYLLGLERFLNENNINFYVYDDSYCVVGNWIEVTLIVEDDNIKEFKTAYKYFKKDYKALIKGYENETEKLRQGIENESQEKIKESEQTFEAEKFIFAGNATFTLESTKTGNRYTYKMTKCKDKKDLYFVGLLYGTDNEKDYKYIGVVDKGNFRTTANSKVKKDTTSVKAFAFFIAKLDKLNKIEGLNIYHEGTCGHCGRKLTTPESIKTGFGPVCMGLM
jgi:hypothetical protein